jgi:hypothetical protein
VFALLQRPDDFSGPFYHAVLRLVGHVTLDADAPLEFLIEFREMRAATRQINAALDNVA